MCVPNKINKKQLIVNIKNGIWNDGSGDAYYIIINGGDLEIRSDPNTGATRNIFVNLTPEDGVPANRTIRIFQSGTDHEIIHNACRDNSGNLYNAIRFGTQVWTAANLKTEHFRNGDVIPYNPGSTSTNPGRFYPQGGVSYVEDYGYLYNWAAVMDTRGLTPTGWHIPSTEEYNTLLNFIKNHPAFLSDGSNQNYNGKCLAYTSEWSTSSTSYAVGNAQSLNNCSGFSAIPAGLWSSGSSTRRSYDINLWTTTEDSSNSSNAMRWRINYNNTYLYSASVSKTYGHSIRLIKD